jgi:hypothetical protein
MKQNMLDVYIDVHIWVYIYMGICMCIYKYIYIYSEGEKKIVTESIWEGYGKHAM